MARKHEINYFIILMCRIKVQAKIELEGIKCSMEYILGKGLYFCIRNYMLNIHQLIQESVKMESIELEFGQDKYTDSNANADINDFYAIHSKNINRANNKQLKYYYQILKSSNKFLQRFY